MNKKIFFILFLIFVFFIWYIQAVRATSGLDWSYKVASGPARWGRLDAANLACSSGSQQSPLDITGTVEAELSPIVIDWKAGGTLVNNGHTIQVDAPEGSRLTRGKKSYDLLQYHFHAPSEHLVEGQAFAMEVHFVHEDSENGGLGVLGVFLVSGEVNETFAKLASVLPGKVGEKVTVVDFDPAGLLPDDLAYWYYRGSLTTPPCTEIVDWMLVRTPMAVAAEDIRWFTALFSGNARPVRAPNRRFILSSQ